MCIVQSYQPSPQHFVLFQNHVVWKHLKPLKCNINEEENLLNAKSSQIMKKHYSVHIFQRINLFRCCLLFKDSSRCFFVMCSKKYCFNNLIWAWCISIESIFGNLPVFVGRLLLPGGNLHVHIWLVHPCRLPFQSGKEWEDTPAQTRPFQVSKFSPLDSICNSCDDRTVFVNSDWSKK